VAIADAREFLERSLGTLLESTKQEYWRVPAENTREYRECI